MNILLMGGLPEEYEGIPISPDFRNMIQADMILHDGELSDMEKTLAILNQLYPQIPPDLKMAYEGFMWFYTRGQAAGEAGPRERAARKAFDFDQDAEIIYASFYEAYHLSLSTVDFLHWWEFMALFERLPESTLMKRVMYWRAVDLGTLSKAERKHVQSMRGVYALKGPGRQPVSAEELSRQTRDRVARRFEEARRQADSRESM